MDDQGRLRREVIPAILYTAAYVAWLLRLSEGEWLRWISLVAVPAAGLWWLRRSAGERAPLRAALASTGLERGRLAAGLSWGIGLGLGLSVLQTFGRESAAIRAGLASPRALWLLPLSFLMGVATAASTEEFFFRGVVQTRLTAALGSNWLSVPVASALFGLYHLPFALTNPRWPSAGDPGAALAAAMETGLPVGLLLGAVYARSRNLVACVVAHAMINMLPAMRLVERWLGSIG